MKMFYRHKTNYKLLSQTSSFTHHIHSAGFAERPLEFGALFPLKCVVALDSSPYTNTLFLKIVHTHDECSLPVVDQSRNVVETHAAP
jgi:hypothetical protein